MTAQSQDGPPLQSGGSVQFSIDKKGKISIAPWLVNALCYDACFRHKLGRDRALAITADGTPRIANPIYAEVVPRHLNYAVQTGLPQRMACGGR